MDRRSGSAGMMLRVDNRAGAVETEGYVAQEPDVGWRTRTNRY